ncbi:uncharacterized protein BDV17DRAFT_293601 [Aspergillus undulatus]|uniref:uncharacterized protein n=1 Tax=Aspergillus undulatus TaxID=1810928 RepID=UPI003CCD6A34
MFEFHPLRKEGDGAISGIVRDGLDPAKKMLLTFCVTCASDVCPEAPTPKPPSPFPHYKPPDIRSRGASRPNCWFLSKAPVEGLYSVHACRDREQEHHPYLGLILNYKDGHVEFIGQIRWHRDIAPEKRAPIHIQYGSLNNKSYINDIATCELESPHSQKIPAQGTVVWWLGQLGDEVAIYTG